MIAKHQKAIGEAFCSPRDYNDVNEKQSNVELMQQQQNIQMKKKLRQQDKSSFGNIPQERGLILEAKMTTMHYFDFYHLKLMQSTTTWP